ncbi:MAG: class II aldolase/adducin family protein [Eggerthellaceae bacterium]|nr:class II aldolase/adducin family protein [Eggerthellaceae bacterium]
MPLSPDMPGNREVAVNVAKTRMVALFRRLYDRGMVNLYEGNISVRLDDRLLVTPSQQSKETMTPQMVVEVDVEGRVLQSAGVAPSSEAGMHREIYRLRPDVRAVIHVHSPYATAFALAGQAIAGNAAELWMLFGGEIPCCAYGTPGTDAVFAEFERYLVDEGRNAVLLANHGLVCVGRDLDEAFARVEAAEKLAQIIWLARALGPENPLPAGETERLRSR